VKFPRATHPNVDYYQVISRKNKTVKVREIGCEQIEATSSMSQMQRPKPDAFVSEAVHTKRISFYNGKPSITVDGHHASLVQVVRFGNAEPLVADKHYSSWYG